MAAVEFPTAHQSGPKSDTLPQILLLCAEINPGDNFRIVHVFPVLLFRSCCLKLVEAVRKPGSVPESGFPFPGNGHSSGYAVTDTLKQPTRRHGRATLNAPLFGLAPDGVYLASDVTARPGELLPHPFTLTCRGRRTSLCGTFPWGHPRWTLSSVTPYGARTFLHRINRQRPSGLLQPNYWSGRMPLRSILPDRNRVLLYCSCNLRIRIRWQWGHASNSSYLYRLLYSCGGRCILHPMQ